MTDLEADLAGIVERKNVRCDPLHLMVYSYDASDLEGNADAVVWAEKTEHVMRILEYANKKNIAVTPRAGGTNLTGGATPYGGIVLDLSRMNKILDEGDDFVLCEPGVVLEDLERHLNKRGKTFPVMPGSDKAAHVGGCIAEDSAGFRAIKYGTMGDWVRWMEVVLPSGSVLETTDQFIVGSEGILGIVTKARLSIIDKPKIRTVTLFEFDSLKDVQSKVIEYAKAGVSALEFISKTANSMVEKPFVNKDKNMLLVEFEDDRGEIKDSAEVARLHEARKSVPTQIAKEGLIIVEDPKIPLENMASFLEAMQRQGVPTYGHIGFGIIHARVEKFEDVKNIIDEASKAGGVPYGEHGIGVLKKDFAVKYDLVKLKSQYDPKNILNPGKVVGPGEGKIPEKLSVCAACGICRGRCPVFKEVLDEVASPRGKALMLEKGVKDEYYRKCTLCKACERACPMNAKFIDDVLRMREKLIEEGIESEANKKMIENVRKHGNPFGEIKKGETPKDLYCC